MTMFTNHIGLEVVNQYHKKLHTGHRYNLILTQAPMLAEYIRSDRDQRNMDGYKMTRLLLHHNLKWTGL